MPCRHYRDPHRRGYIWAVGRGTLHRSLPGGAATHEVAVCELLDATPTGTVHLATVSEWQSRLEADDPPPTIGPDAWPLVRKLVAEALAWPIATDDNTPGPGETLVSGEWPAARQTALAFDL